MSNATPNKKLIAQICQRVESAIRGRLENSSDAIGTLAKPMLLDW
jgi:hypothetical protein